MGAEEIVIGRPSPAELEARFMQVLADVRFAEIGHWELNDDGEIVVSAVSGEHGRAQAVLCAEFERQIGGRAWIEQAIRRADGAPLLSDVLWADTAFFEANKSHGLLPTAPRLCIEVVSASNAMTRLREKCGAYLRLARTKPGSSMLPRTWRKCIRRRGDGSKPASLSTSTRSGASCRNLFFRRP